MKIETYNVLQWLQNQSLLHSKVNEFGKTVGLKIVPERAHNNVIYLDEGFELTGELQIFDANRLIASVDLIDFMENDFEWLPVEFRQLTTKQYICVDISSETFYVAFRYFIKELNED